MKITNNGISNARLLSNPAVQDPQASTQDPATDVASTDANGYTPSPEWVRLLDQVKAQPEIRSDRVQAAQERLSQGFYATADSASKTADAMLAFSNAN